MTNSTVTIEPIQPEDKDAFVALMFSELGHMHGCGYDGKPFSDAFLMEETVNIWNTLLGFNPSTTKEKRAKHDDKGFVVAKNEISKLHVSTHQCQVARCNGEVIGLVDYNVRGNIVIHHIVVAEKFRGKSLARALLSAAAIAIKARNKKEFQFNVRNGNESSMKLFNKLADEGFLQNPGLVYIGNLPTILPALKGKWSV